MAVDCTFDLTQTGSARKFFSITKKLQKEMERAARLVVQQELPKIERFALSAIAMSDDELLELNRSALQHEDLTDILTFEIERTKTALEVEIYLSIERAKENANIYRQPIERELLHLVIHGVLHLAGYTDKMPSKRK
ncbi:MAG TPA: rRNA maturation RNase YbeY, partial [Candidatus Kapabacteria bacterium]